MFFLLFIVVNFSSNVDSWLTVTLNQTNYCIGSRNLIRPRYTSTKLLESEWTLWIDASQQASLHKKAFAGYELSQMKQENDFSSTNDLSNCVPLEIIDKTMSLKARNLNKITVMLRGEDLNKDLCEDFYVYNRVSSREEEGRKITTNKLCRNTDYHLKNNLITCQYKCTGFIDSLRFNSVFEPDVASRLRLCNISVK